MGQGGVRAIKRFMMKKNESCIQFEINNNNNKHQWTTKDNLAGYSTHFEEGAIKLKTGYPLAPQDHGLVSALKIISKH